MDVGAVCVFHLMSLISCVLRMWVVSWWTVDFCFACSPLCILTALLFWSISHKPPCSSMFLLSGCQTRGKSKYVSMSWSKLIHCYIYRLRSTFLFLKVLLGGFCWFVCLLFLCVKLPAGFSLSQTGAAGAKEESLLRPRGGNLRSRLQGLRTCIIECMFRLRTSHSLPWSLFHSFTMWRWITAARLKTRKTVMIP